MQIHWKEQESSLSINTPKRTRYYENDFVGPSRLAKENPWVVRRESFYAYETKIKVKSLSDEVSHPSKS